MNDRPLHTGQVILIFQTELVQMRKDDWKRMVKDEKGKSEG